jgi:ABC-type transport system involved in multi-copper enzyme maturation permease subunit
MSLALRQFAAMAYYETLMQWRRRPVVVLTLALLFTGVVLYLVGRESLMALQAGAVTGGAADDHVLMYSYLMLVWPPIAAVLIFILPMLMADVIPLDQSLKTGELLRSLPLSNLTYILGKLTGAWASVIIGVLVAVLIQTLLWAFGSQRLMPQFIFSMVFLGIVPLVILCGGLGILIGATQPTRRRAFGVVLLFVCIAALAGGFQTELSNPVTYLSPLRMPFFSYFMSVQAVGLSSEINMLSVPFELPHLALSALVGAVELVIAAGLLLFNFRYQETH